MSKEPIAIVGMSCRFPKVNNLQEFWALLSQGKDTIDTIKRWDIEEYYNPDKSAKDKTNQRHGSMFEKIDDFDPLFFNISPAEAAEMSPSQKLMMELTWECLESSNIPFEKVAGKKIGVYVGNIWSDFEHHRKHKHAEVTSHSAVGQSANIIANRISFFYGFSGPSLVVDTGCSSSLVALHLACQSLWDGSIEQSIVGGVNHMLDPDQNVLLSKFGGLSVKGKCSTFDAGADGFVRGEGGGIILLKKLSDAERDGDKIFAVIRGTALNNNGYNQNLPATSVAGQLDVLNEAYQDSGINPADVHYVEAHGTGTKLGDPTETKALGTFFSKNRKRPLHVGSVKTNIGHLEGAAGMAGLIKSVLAINNKQLPKNLNFNTPNPEIDFEKINVKVQAEHSEWPVEGDETMKVGVNSFGWGGTNGHTVIEEYRPASKKEETNSHDKHSKHVLPISGRSEKALLDYVKSYKHFLTNHLNGKMEDFISTNIASAIRKPAFDYRKLFVANNKLDMIAQLEEYLRSGSPDSTVVEKPKVAFIFPGQGSQWLGMGQGLYIKEPVFKQAIDECDAAFAKYCDWSLISQLNASEEESRLNEIDVIQPALCAMQIALARLWQSFGVTADAVTGHSMGEVAAAHISGSISLDEAARVICTRSKLMKTVSGTGGAMAVTELTVPEAEEAIKQYPGLSIAVNNSPKSTVLAGDQSLISDLLDELEKQGKFCRQVKVDVASHSAQMEPLKAKLAVALQEVNPVKNTTKLYSTVENKLIEGESLNAGYWVNNLRNGVQFAGVMEQLIADGYNVFIEVSPHPVLTTAVTECLDAYNGSGVTSGTLYRNKPEVVEFYSSLDSLYQQGLNIDWNQKYDNPTIPTLALPAYPFQRSTYTLTERKNAQKTSKEGHPWVGKELKLAQLDGYHFWEAHIGIEEFPYLTDHAVSGKVVLPGVSYVEMLTTALRQLTGQEAVSFRNLQFKSAITLEEGQEAHVQLKISTDKKSFQFYQQIDGNWTETACGSFSNQTTNATETHKIDFIAATSKENYYQQLEGLGLQYGNYFQGIEGITVSGNDVYANVTVHQQLVHSLGKYQFHPAVLDACLQTLFAKHTNFEKDVTCSTYLTGIDAIEVFKPMWFSNELKVHTTITKEQKTNDGQCDEISANVIITDSSGEVLVKLTQLAGKIFRFNDNEEDQANWYYKTNYEKLALSTGKGKSKSILVIEAEEAPQTSEFAERLTAAGHKVDLLSMRSEGLKSMEDYNADEVIFFALSRFASDTVKLERASALNFLEVVKALEGYKSDKTPQLTVVTNGTAPVESAHINLSQAGLVGLSKVAFNEVSQYEVKHLDLSYTPNPQELNTLATLIGNPIAKEKEIAIRGNSIFAQRLETYSPDVYDLQKTKFSSIGTYVVTGYKGIAFSMVEWMFECGVRNFCLISRSTTLDDLLQEKIHALKGAGARISIEACDVNDYNTLDALLKKVNKERPIKGIVHAAGLIKAQQLVEIEEKDLDFAMDAKVQGAWNLHRISSSFNLDHFVLFSSASSLLGLTGQASYVAANASLDALAQFRQKHNLPANSINWGVMSDVGMVASGENLEKFAKAEGFEATPMHEAVSALSKVFDQNHTNLGVFKIDTNQAAEYFPALGASNYFKPVITDNDNANDGQSLLKTMQILPSNEDRLEAIELHIKKLTAGIIKMAESDLSTKSKFKSLGIDSLMAVQFRNKLEKALEVKLSVTEIWEHPTIAEYSQFLLNKLFGGANENHKKGEKQPVITVEEATDSTKIQLICFHDAGGSAALYDDWKDFIDEKIQLVTVELPGRGKSSSTAPLNKMGEAITKITDALLPVIDKPFMFMGHSMGGLIAFEVARELRRRHATLPVKMFVSSTPQLSAYDKTTLDPNATDAQLEKRFLYLSNTADPELKAILIKQLRGDLNLISSYKYDFEPPLDLNIIGIHGVNDETVSTAQMSAWKNETTLNFKLIEREGDHHYLRNDVDFVTELINKEVINPTTKTVEV
ncbi:SDR family NAD(P)-dependent oxidoreductase [Fulvivirga sp. RKSG066]|uniref:type I polyketide synthase n=1 Tax=Fulvivirga aurantia TaxID=2529383 RepID=UPI0012BC6158|nr:type I polyketide synthase [Fulvivirga aurantia]MTI22241.1 SDR family NAD(P)-dependent oxidoreductase [Fulvivirga aurantia]